MQRYIGASHGDAATDARDSTKIGGLLVTGGTGFIGGGVLAELLESPLWKKTRLLVRAKSIDEARQRIISSIERFRPAADPASLVTNDQIFLAGLEDTACLSNDARIGDITHVIHAAAVTSFSKSPRIKAVNVDASLAFVRALVDRADIKRFVYVGTAWCVGVETGATVPEGQQHGNGKHLVPYTESKLIFEREARKQFPDLPFVTARPSIVVGHTQLGVEPSASIYWVFHSAALIGSFTCSLDDRIDVVPVDWVARALVDLATRPDLKFDAYHLSAGNGAASKFEAIDVAIARGLNSAPHGRERYRHLDEKQLALTVFSERKKFGGASPWLLAPALTLYGRFARSGTTFDNSRLLSEGIAPPPSFCSYADVCAKTAKHLSIGKQMEDDFK
jgi:nucleoside-diphosphate-sugar epimerase